MDTFCTVYCYAVSRSSPDICSLTRIYYDAGCDDLSFSASNGVVLATEKKQKSILYDEQSVHKVEPITKHIGMVYSGMGPDYRWELFTWRSLSKTKRSNRVFSNFGPTISTGCQTAFPSDKWEDAQKRIKSQY